MNWNKLVHSTCIWKMLSCGTNRDSRWWRTTSSRWRINQLITISTVNLEVQSFNLSERQSRLLHVSARVDEWFFFCIICEQFWHLSTTIRCESNWVTCFCTTTVIVIIKVKRYLINYPVSIWVWADNILSFLSIINRATAPGQYEYNACYSQYYQRSMLSGNFYHPENHLQHFYWCM